MTISKKCESFGCTTAGVRMFQLAPGTNVWLCDKCIEDLKKPDASYHGSMRNI